MARFAAAVLLAVSVLSSAGAVVARGTALEVRLSIEPSSPRALEPTRVEIRTFSPLLRADSSCCRLEPGGPAAYPFRVVAFSPAGKALRVDVTKRRGNLWQGTFRFTLPGRWLLRVVNSDVPNPLPGTRPRMWVRVKAPIATPPAPGFDRPAATVGDRITVRASGFASKKPLRVYLAARSDVPKIRGRFDRRLHFVGVLNPSGGRASTTFVLPPLSSGRYVAWCVSCRSRATLQVTMPAATPDFCPATPPTSHAVPSGLDPAFRWHGNGRLWTLAWPDGVWNADRRLVQPDGTIFNKQLWVARPTFGKLAVTLQRLDAPASMLSMETVSGHLSGWSGPSWAARMRFPAPGCWLVRGRVEDVTLSYVVKVVLSSA